ncbi:hypothetical protein BJF86_13425 [Serinicoccus sp. CNJ-927]|uniref:hypothetical protein n=1 Tax=Serinicoccus sp. CNJ-927 TaxID=1904970 RepID=UPI00095B1AB4|nr:hypothetical protein [Serinicoccus sp. CNJ-927]OLT43952.1 hypothetical protein BJF86_13425 [Serinicoccus sp. CNJ-927]
MSRTTTLHTRITRTARALHQDGERGGISVELVVLVIGLFVLAGLVIAGVTAFVTGQLGQLG